MVEVKSLRRSPKLQTPTDWWAFLCGAPRMGTEPFYNYCTGSPQTGIWSSVMKTTLQLEHSKICEPSSGNAARPVSRIVIERPQLGQGGFCVMTGKRLRPGKVPRAARSTLPQGTP